MYDELVAWMGEVYMIFGAVYCSLLFVLPVLAEYNIMS